MSILLLFVLGLAALLFIVALIARFALVAHSSRLSAGWLAELFAHLSPPLESLAKQCQTGYLALVRWPVKRPADHESYNSAVALLFRLLCLPLSLAILLADFSLTQLRSAALYHLTPTLLHLPLNVLLGVIWVLVPIAWALLLAEALGRLPAELWLFPPLQSGRWLRLVIGLFALVGFLSALVLNFGFQIYGQCVLIQGCQT